MGQLGHMFLETWSDAKVTAACGTDQENQLFFLIYT
jgi:hypothetical protein